MRTFYELSRVKSRVDILIHSAIDGKDMYSKVWSVARMFLVFCNTIVMMMIDHDDNDDVCRKLIRFVSMLLAMAT